MYHLFIDLLCLLGKSFNVSGLKMMKEIPCVSFIIFLLSFSTVMVPSKGGHANKSPQE